MASEKQITANRANAKRSTGSRTAVGRAKSSRNAHRHGLSVPVSLDPTIREQIEKAARTVAGDGATDQTLQAVQQIVETQFELMRVRATRAAATGPALELALPPGRLLALDRYERLAISRRKTAVRTWSLS